MALTEERLVAVSYTHLDVYKRQTQENLAKVNFEPGISVDINFVTTIGIKLILDISLRVRL